MNEIVSSEVSSIEKIKKVIHLHIDITLRNPDALACLNNDWMHLEDKDLNYFLKMRTDYEENFRKIVKQGIASEQIKNLNQEVIIFSTLSTLRTLYLWYNKAKSLNDKVLKNDLEEILLKGIV